MGDFPAMVSKHIQNPTRNFASVAFRLNFAKTKKKNLSKNGKKYGGTQIAGKIHLDYHGLSRTIIIFLVF